MLKNRLTFLLEPLEPRWFLDATPLDLPATVQGSFPQTYDVALKAGLLYSFRLAQSSLDPGWIRLECDDWQWYQNFYQGDALQVRPAKDVGCDLRVENQGSGEFTLSAREVPENQPEVFANAAPIAPGDMSEEFSEPDQSHWYKFSAISDSRYRFKTTLQTLSQSTVRLLDSNGREIATGSRWEVAGSIQWVAPASGDYYLRHRLQRRHLSALHVRGN